MSETGKIEPEKMLDVLYYRDAVLEIILGGKRGWRNMFTIDFFQITPFIELTT